MSDFKVPLIIRGEVIEDYEVEHHDRSLGRSFLTPNVAKYADRMVAKSAAALNDLYTISFDEICEYLGELGRRLDLDKNPHWREAFEVSCYASNMSRSVLEAVYRNTAPAFDSARVREVAEVRIGIRFLEGWVRTRLADGRAIDVRAMGSRSAHVIAGNVPFTAAGTMIRCALTRNDAIVKAPSNDPLTMVAIARTMIEMAPDHPITRHLTVGYWKGGDEAIESRIYHPQHIEKLVAWGGQASIRHIVKYIQPGIDLITMDPKLSMTMIGREALADDATMRTVAMRAAADLGAWDQEACVNARVMYLESGTDAHGLELANRFGRYLFEAVQQLPKTTSAGCARFNPELKQEVQALLQNDSFYKVFTDPERLEKTGAVIVSQMSEQVDFPSLLYGRVGNLVPVDNIEEALHVLSSATQTVGIYPDDLRVRLRDRVAIMGSQRMIPLGYAMRGTMAGPHDGMEVERRMCRWVVDMHADPRVTRGPWVHEGETASPPSAPKVKGGRAKSSMSVEGAH
jgi:Acyl-CoA reductase (LuxC)